MEQHKYGLLHKPQIIRISLLIEKGIFGLDILVARLRWVSGMALARVGIKGHLSMKKKYAQVQVQRGAQKPKQRQKREKPRKRKSCENRGVTSVTTDGQELCQIGPPRLNEQENGSLRPSPLALMLL